MGKPNITAIEGEEKKQPVRRSVSMSIENYNAVLAIATKERRGIGDQLDIILETFFKGPRASTSA